MVWFKRLHLWGWLGLSFLVSLLGAYISGRRAATKDVALKQVVSQAKDSEKVRQVKERINALDDAALRERSKRWVRNK